MKQYFEVDAPVDDRYIWVAADSRKQVEACVAGYATVSFLGPPPAARFIDYHLPDDVAALRERIGWKPLADALPAAYEGSCGWYLNDPNGRWAASYMPAKTVVCDGPSGTPTTTVEQCPEAEARFWGVYRYDTEGLATCVGDADDKTSAAAFAELVRRDVLRERGFVDVPYGTVPVNG